MFLPVEQTGFLGRRSHWIWSLFISHAHLPYHRHLPKHYNVVAARPNLRAGSCPVPAPQDNKPGLFDSQYLVSRSREDTKSGCGDHPLSHSNSRAVLACCAFGRPKTVSFPIDSTQYTLLLSYSYSSGLEFTVIHFCFSSPPLYFNSLPAPLRSHQLPSPPADQVTRAT